MRALQSWRSPSPARRIGVVGALLVSVAGTTASAQFNYADFTNVAGLSLVDSFRSGSSLIITPASTRVAGAAWYVADKQNVSLGWETEIRFRISDILGTGADGIAFVIQNHSASALGGTGGAIGYGSNQYFDGATPRGIPNSVAVEFDTWMNGPHDWPDLNGNHVSIQSRGLLPNDPSHEYSLGAATVPTDMSDGQVHTAVISYVQGGLMRIFVDDLVNPLVTANVNLDSWLALDSGRAWVGITGATGGATDVQTHEILSWRFTVIPAPGGAALLGLGGLLALRRRR
jgi:hypothetical protein